MLNNSSSELIVQNHFLNPFPKAQTIPTVNYLLVLDYGYFLAVRMDDNIGNYVKCIGFFTNAKIERIQKRHRKMIEDTVAEKFVEISIPWERIQYIQSLNYRYKGK